MKFKHYTMEELEKMTQDQQRGYVLAELIYGLGKALVDGMKGTEIFETTAEQSGLISEMERAFKQAITLYKNTMTEDTGELELLLKRAVDAPKALNYE